MSATKSLRELTETVRGLLPELRERYRVASLALFGSYVRHQEGPGSDLDVLVAFEQSPGLLEFVELENHLTDALGVKVDLVMKESLKPRIGKRILSEAVPV